MSQAGYIEDMHKYTKQIERYNMSFTLGGISNIEGTSFKRVRFNYKGKPYSILVKRNISTYSEAIKSKIEKIERSLV